MWSVTINNPTAQDDESISLARQKGWKVIGQLEKGENGTPHYQLAVRTPQVRFSALKKMFPRAHIELARSPPALLNYAVKEETRAGVLPTQQDKFPSLSKYWDLVFVYLNGLEKDGLDYVVLEEGKVKFFDEGRERLYRKTPLVMLDEATRHLITQGYHVEGIGGNPNTRSQWKLYSDSILLRSYDAIKNVRIEIQQDADDNQNAQWSGQEEGLQVHGGTEDTQSAGPSSGETDSDGSSQDREGRDLTTE